MRLNVTSFQQIVCSHFFSPQTMVPYAARLPVQPGTSYTLHPLSGSPVLFWKPIVSAVQWKNMEKQLVNVSAMLYLVLGIKVVTSAMEKPAIVWMSRHLIGNVQSNIAMILAGAPLSIRTEVQYYCSLMFSFLRSIAVAALHFRCKYWTVSVFVWWLFFPKLSNSWKLMFDQFHIRVIRILTNECVQH